MTDYVINYIINVASKKVQKSFKEGLNIMKKVGEVFSDYKLKGSIASALVENVKVKKRSRIMEMEISSDDYIELQEIEDLIIS